MPESYNNKISVIIPTLNEEENIGELLQFLKQNGKDHIADIIVCDAKSEDETTAIAKKMEVR
jgi:glycosyltransferase involved in cell wall biosynthesis|tara:strand:+ start:453 stop:638 length:186 start_codon:yes stop_codon:yes gene_type:complete